MTTFVEYLRGLKSPSFIQNRIEVSLASQVVVQGWIQAVESDYR